MYLFFYESIENWFFFLIFNLFMFIHFLLNISFKGTEGTWKLLQFFFFKFREENDKYSDVEMIRDFMFKMIYEFYQYSRDRGNWL